MLGGTLCRRRQPRPPPVFNTREPPASMQAHHLSKAALFETVARAASCAAPTTHQESKKMPRKHWEAAQTRRCVCSKTLETEQK